MRSFTVEAKIGLFFLACLAIFAYVYFKVLEFDFKEGFVLKAEFGSVEGLTEGAGVRIAGIRVGKVKTISFDKQAGKAVVTMEIRREYLNSIPEDSRVMIKTEGLLGDKYVLIEIGKPNARKLDPGDEFKLVYEPAGTQEVLESLGVVAQDVQQLTREARHQIIDEKGGERLQNVIVNADKSFADLQEILSKNKDTIDSTIQTASRFSKRLDALLSRNTDKLNQTIDNAEEASTDVKKILSRNREKINNTVDGLESFSGDIDKTGARLRTLATELEQLTREVRSGRGTLGRLVKDESLYRQADALVRDLRQLSYKIQYGSGTVSRVINDPAIYFEARRAIRNLSKTAEDLSETTPISTMATIVGAVIK